MRVSRLDRPVRRDASRGRSTQHQGRDHEPPMTDAILGGNDMFRCKLLPPRRSRSGPGAGRKGGEPIRIGFGMALTGPLAANGKSALLAQKIWEEDINAKGGLLGRPVKLVYYDDQSNPSTVPGIYTKLLDVDKVDLDHRRLRHQHAGAGHAGRDAEEQAVHRPARARGEHRVQLPELLRHDPVRPRSEARLHQGLLRRRDGAEPEAEDGRDRRRRRRVLAQRLRRRARERQGRRPQDRLRQDLSAGDHRLRADRARDPGHQSGPRGHLLLSARLGRHGARRQRDRLQAQDDRRRHGRPAGDRVQDAARAAAQRHRQLRLLAAGAEDALPGRRGPDEEVPGARRRRGRRSARLLHGAVGLRAAAGAGAGDRGDQEPRRRQARRLHPRQHVQDRGGRREVRQGRRMGAVARAAGAVPGHQGQRRRPVPRTLPARSC